MVNYNPKYAKTQTVLKTPSISNQLQHQFVNTFKLPMQVSATFLGNVWHYLTPTLSNSITTVTILVYFYYRFLRHGVVWW